MKKQFQFTLILLLTCSLLSANAQQTISGKFIKLGVRNMMYTDICLKRIAPEGGQIVAQATIDPEGNYQMTVDNSMKGLFFVNVYTEYYPVFLNGKDNIHLNVDKAIVSYEGKLGKENAFFKKWQEELMKDINIYSFSREGLKKTHRELFSLVNEVTPRAEKMMKGKKTGNKLLDSELDFVLPHLYAYDVLFFFGNGHEGEDELTRDMYSPYIIDRVEGDYFNNARIMELPFGKDEISLSAFITGAYLRGITNGTFENIAYDLCKDPELRAELILSNSKYSCKSIADYPAYEAKYLPQMVTASQKNRFAEIKKRLSGLQPGDAAYPFNYADKDGEFHALADFKGKYVLVDVWATWCGPCKREIPFLKKLEQEMKDKNIAFVGISIDNANDYDKWETMVNNGDVDGIQLFSNNDHKFTEAYDIKAIPRFMLFDPEGKVVNINLPYPSTGELNNLLNSIVK